MLETFQIVQETPGGPFKLIDDGSLMDVDDQTNSNHASNVDGDEHQSNHLNLDTANSSTNNTINNLTSPSVPNRSNNSRVSDMGFHENEIDISLVV